MRHCGTPDGSLGVTSGGTLDRGDGVPLAWEKIEGHGPTLVFLPGLRSDMRGTKAEAIAGFCEQRGVAMLRLDYAGHGESGGRFEDGCIGRWRDDARAIIDAHAPGPKLLMGSSMGGWIALLLARDLGIEIIGLIGIAAAPDFTEDLMWDRATPAQQAALMRDGIVHQPSPYGPPLPITRALIEDGRRHLVLRARLPLRCPVRLLHGMQDLEVPFATTLRLAERLETRDVQILLIKDGDHRLSRPDNLDSLRYTISGLLSHRPASDALA